MHKLCDRLPSVLKGSPTRPTKPETTADVGQIKGRGSCSARPPAPEEQTIALKKKQSYTREGDIHERGSPFRRSQHLAVHTRIVHLLSTSKFKQHNAASHSYRYRSSTMLQYGTCTMLQRVSYTMLQHGSSTLLQNGSSTTLQNGSSTMLQNGYNTMLQQRVARRCHSD